MDNVEQKIDNLTTWLVSRGDPETEILRGRIVGEVVKLIAAETTRARKTLSNGVNVDDITVYVVDFSGNKTGYIMEHYGDKPHYPDKLLGSWVREAVAQLNKE